MYMVVSQLLQKHKSSFVSVLTGGFESLLRCLSDVNVDTTKWIVGEQCKFLSIKFYMIFYPM